MRKIAAITFILAILATMSLAAGGKSPAPKKSEQPTTKKSEQSSSGLKDGDQIINLGVGIGSVLGGTGYGTSIPPISLSYERGVKDLSEKSAIGVGAYVAYSANKWESSILGDTYGWKYSYTIIGARGAFHYNVIDQLDSYAGLMLGYNIVSAEAFGGGYSYGGAASASAPLFSFFVGSRYYFNENVGAFAEFGYGVAWFNLGLAYKF